MKIMPLSVPTSILCLLAVLILNQSCGGGDKHLPSSNPPEYDPQKVYTTPSAPLSAPVTVTKPAEPSPPPIQLPTLEPGPNEKGEWKKLPVNMDALQSLKNAQRACDALSNLIKGVGSGQLFDGKEGQTLKASLGSQADSVARSLDQQLFDMFKPRLGPNVADCPSPASTWKKSDRDEFFSSGRVVRTTGRPNGSFQLAQVPAVPALEDGYTVTRNESRQEAPPGWVGWKTITRMTRVGNKPETAGNSRSMLMIVGGKVLKCPTPDGVVPGDFELAVVLDETIVESGMTRLVHMGLHASATLKGQVGDDAKVQYVEGELSTVAERNGTDVPTSVLRRRSQFRFALGRTESFPGFPTDFTVLSATGWDVEGATPQENSFASNAIAAVMLWGGQNYMDAEREWHKPNNCVQITFTPATKTRKFVANASTPVRTELRTKKEQALVPAKFKEAKERPREGNGRVSPRDAESRREAPATFTYQAPATRVRHSGFAVAAVSRAGVAIAKDGEWELAPAAYVLEFKSHIVQEALNIVNPQFGISMSSNGFDAHVQATVPLQHTDDRGWVGESVMQYTTRTMTQPAQCEIRIQGNGTTTFHVNGGSISLDPEPFAVNLIILPGQSGEMAETHCTSGNTPEKLKELFATQGVHDSGEAHMSTKGGGWSGAFNLTRFRTFNWDKKGYEIGGWTPVGGSDVIAKKTIMVNCSAGLTACQEETTLILRLADDPSAGASPAP